MRVVVLSSYNGLKLQTSVPDNTSSHVLHERAKVVIIIHQAVNVYLCVPILYLRASVAENMTLIYCIDNTWPIHYDIDPDDLIYDQSQGS